MTKLPPALRRSLVVLVTGLTSVGVVVAAALPAHAAPAEGWPVADPVDLTHLLLLVLGLPLLLFVVITAAVLLPALVRGERIAPGAPAMENQWLGGPRKTAGELAGPGTISTEVGGASGRW